jgi:hypothetical protein
MQKSIAFVAPGGSNPITISTFVPDYNKVRLVHMAGGLSLDALVINEMINKIATNESGDPLWYCVDSKMLYIYPYAGAGASILLYYYMMVPKISPTVDFSIFTTYHEDALLYAACKEAAPYMVEDERVATWSQIYTDTVEDINATAKKATHGSAPLKRQITGLS